MKDLLDIINDMEMCPMERTIIINRLNEPASEFLPASKKVYLPKGIEDYIIENVGLRSKPVQETPVSFTFGIDIVSQYPEHIPMIVNKILAMTPEECPNTTTTPITALGENPLGGTNVSMGRLLERVRFDSFIAGLVLEYIGVYEEQFVLVVYNRLNWIQGYTLLNIRED